MLSLEGAWSIAMEKLLTLGEQHIVDCDKVDSARTVSSWTSGLRSPRRTAHFTGDSACDGELTDFGFAFAAKNALCTETAAVQLESMVRARLRPGFRIQGVAVNSRISSGVSKVTHFASIYDFLHVFGPLDDGLDVPESLGLHVN